MRSRIVCTLAAVCLLICGCPEDKPKLMGSGVAKTEMRKLPEFQRVNFYGKGQLELAAGLLEALSITTDDNILPVLMTTVDDGTLTIRPAEEDVQFKTPLVIRAASPDINEVHSMGSGDITLKSAGAEQVRLSVMGAGRVQAGGQATAVDISIKGAGEVDTTSLEAERVTVTITGAGSAEVNAAKNLDVTITGAGTVRYVGDPAVSKKITGVGTISQK